MTKFIKTIVGDAQGVKAQRAAVLATQAKLAQEELISNLKRRLSANDLQLAQLVDLAPDTTDSLRPGNGFEPASWVKAVHALKVEAGEIKDELAIAEETYFEWFAEVPAATA